MEPPDFLLVLMYMLLDIRGVVRVGIYTASLYAVYPEFLLAVFDSFL